MKFAVCEICNKELKDWSGNVMIPKKTDDETIEDLQIWCKECTVKEDKQGIGHLYHNLWELSWVKEDGESILNETGYSEQFSKHVKEKLLSIIRNN